MKEKAKRIKILMLAALIICCIGGVFAYWTQVLIAHNEFETARYDTKLNEIFKAPDDWIPGQEINKDVWISNEGNIPVFVKVVINQTWKDADGSIPLVFDADGKDEYAALIKWGDVVLLSSGKTGNIDLGLPVVDSIEAAKGKWLLMSDEPDENGDFMLFCIGMVDAGKTTPLLVDSVTMNPAIQPRVIGKKLTYNKETGEQELEEVLNTTYSYESARYTMFITATTVQATASAVRDVFGTTGASKDVVKYLADHGLSEDYFAQ